MYFEPLFLLEIPRIFLFALFFFTGFLLFPPTPYAGGFPSLPSSASSSHMTVAEKCHSFPGPGSPSRPVPPSVPQTLESTPDTDVQTQPLTSYPNLPSIFCCFRWMASCLPVRQSHELLSILGQTPGLLTGQTPGLLTKPTSQTRLLKRLPSPRPHLAPWPPPGPPEARLCHPGSSAVATKGHFSRHTQPSPSLT